MPQFLGCLELDRAATSGLIEVRAAICHASKMPVAKAGDVCDLATFETLRIEAGTPLFGVDFNDTNLPQEVGRDAVAISFTKGCYLGQETVARLDALGHVNQKIAGAAVRQDADVPGSRHGLSSRSAARRSRDFGNIFAAAGRAAGDRDAET